MKVLIFLPYFTHGGAEKQGALLARRLVSLGHEVEAWAFATPNANASFRQELSDIGIRCRELPVVPDLVWGKVGERLGLRTRLRRALEWRRQVATLAQTLPVGRFDVLVPFTFLPSTLAALCRNQLGAAVTLWNHRGGYDAAGVEYSEFLVRQITRARPVFVANSAPGCRFLSDTFHLPRTAVHLVQNFVTPSSVSKAAPPTDHTCQLVHVANLFPEKDLSTVLQALRLLKDRGVTCHLHVAGTFPGVGQEQQFHQDVGHLDLHGFVTHHGGLAPDATQALIAQCDVGLLSSRSEGCPNSVLEYMQAGLPVIGTRIEGIAELVGEAGAPFLFQCGDATELQTLLERLILNRELREQLGRANQRRLVAAYNPDVALAQWLMLLVPQHKRCPIVPATLASENAPQKLPRPAPH